MKASKRRARQRKQIKQGKSQSQSVVAAAFSELEEAFFREGAALSAVGSNNSIAVETFADLEDTKPRQRPSLWRRLFA